MTKNNLFQEYLTESLNSAPYPYELEAKSTSMDRFYIIDAEGQKYRLWFEVRKALGAKVMQVVIGKAETNPKIYKKIIQRFENPMRIFATMMEIFREGVKGGDNYMKAQDGFAIALPESQFDRFESLLGRVMKRVLTGTQFEEAKGNISFTNEEFFYLPVVRKGKKPEEVFSGKEVVQTSAQTANGASAATQSPTPAPKALAPAPAPAPAPKPAPKPVAKPTAPKSNPGTIEVETLKRPDYDGSFDLKKNGTGIGDMVELVHPIAGCKYGQVYGMALAKKGSGIIPPGMPGAGLPYGKVRLMRISVTPSPLATGDYRGVYDVPFHEFWTIEPNPHQLQAYRNNPKDASPKPKQILKPQAEADSDTAAAFDEKKAAAFLKNNPLGTIINPLPVGKQRELLIQHLKGAKWVKERMGKSINEYFKTTIDGKELTFMPIMSTVNKMNGRLRVPSGTRRKAYIYINYNGNSLPNLEFGVAIGETDSANKAKDANLASMKKFMETLTGMTLGNYGWYSTN